MATVNDLQQVVVDGLKIQAPKTSRIANRIAATGFYGWPVVQAIIRNLLPGDHFVDVGANIGYYTLIAARIVGDNGLVSAFEPDPENFRILQMNVYENGFSENTNLFQMGLSNAKSDCAQLHLNPKNDADHRIYLNPSSNDKIPITLKRLDDAGLGCDKVDLLKIDTQGADGLVLEGAQNIIKSNPELKMIIEFWPCGLEESAYGTQRFIDTLFSAGFAPVVLGLKPAGKTLSPSGLSEFAKKLSGRKYVNLFCSCAKKNGSDKDVDD